MESFDAALQWFWDGTKSIPLCDHILFPSIVALSSFHLHCLLFTLYDAFILHRAGVKEMLWECARPQIIAHVVLNVISFMVIDVRRDLPAEAPSAFEFVRDMILCYLIGDFFIYHEHVIMHRVPFLRHNVHATHHKYTKSMFSYNAGWVHPVEIAVAAICELAYPLCANVHPFTVWVFLWTWIIWLVEEHSGDDVRWSMWNVAPWIGGGAPPHSLHHSPHLTKNFGFVFSCWDRMFGTFEAPSEGKTHRSD